MDNLKKFEMYYIRITFVLRGWGVNTGVKTGVASLAGVSGV